MLAAYAVSADADTPLNALRVGQIDPPPVPDGWVEVEVRAASLNHHDVFSLRGIGLPADRLPMILGCDAAGVTADGREVVVYAVINDPGFADNDETYDPRRSLLSERYPGHARRGRPGPRRKLSSTSPPELTLRRSRVPADSLADGVPGAVHLRRTPAGRHRARPGRGWGFRDGGDGDRPGRRLAGLGHLS